MKIPNDKIVCCVTPSGKENKYIDLMRSALRKIDVEPVSKKQRDASDYIWHHWIEKTPYLSLIKLYKATQKKIIWNVHNKIPHDAKDVQQAKAFMAATADAAHKIVIHCKESVEVVSELCENNPDVLDKIVYVPHPNYIGVYGPEKRDNSLSNDKLSLCFFGKVKEYKNIELLIAAINELNYNDVELKIIGRCWNPQYFHNLIGDNKHIKTDFRFIDDSEIPEISANSHLFVFPYNTASSLNSGATLLAFSYGRSVLSSLTGTLADVEDKSMFFSYSYNNPAEHKEMLKQQITAIRNQYKGDYNELLTLGERCRNYVSEHNSLERVAKQLSLVFDNREKAPRNISTRLAGLQLRIMLPARKIMLLGKKAFPVIQNKLKWT